MTSLERDIERLHRYHDGEMSRLGRIGFERRLRRSPALRAELAALEQIAASIEFAAAELAPQSVPDFWPAIRPALASVDTEVEVASQRRVRATVVRPGERGFPFGLPGLAVGAAALAAVAVFVLRSPGGPPTGPGSAAVAPVLARTEGVVRYLDSGGAPVLVIEDDESDMTIVWMMDAV